MGPEKSSYKRSWRVLEKVDGRLQALGVKEEIVMYYRNSRDKGDLQ